MSCDFISVDGTIHVPAGCLCGEEIDIPCKGPDEKVLYVFSLKRRLRQDDSIVSVKSSADDPSIQIQFISCDEKTFTVLISGGQLGKKSALHFSVTTTLEEERTFTAALCIMPDGTITDDEDHHYDILPGSAGKDATIKIGTVTTVAPRSLAKVTNSGDATDACFNFDIPKGDIEPQGPQGVKGDTGSQGISYDNNGTVDLNVNTLKSDGGKISTNGTGALTLNGGVITYNNVLIKPWKINDDKTTSNSSLVFYNLTEDNKQSITLRMSSDGNLVIGDWIKNRPFTTNIDYHLNVSGNLSVKGNLTANTLTSDNGGFRTNGRGGLILSGGVNANNNILLRPLGINDDKTTNNSSLVLYNLTGDNEQSITLYANQDGNFIIGDWIKSRPFTTIINYHLNVNGDLSVKGKLTANTLTSDNRNFRTNGKGGLILNGGIIANNNILLKPLKVNADKTTSNSSFVLYNLTGDSEQSITLNANPQGDLIIGDWVKKREFTTVINYHLNVGGNVSVGGDISTSGNIATTTLKLADGLYLNSNSYAKLGVPTQIGCTKFCTDAYSTLNPQKNKGIIVVWNGTKWVDVLGADIATA